MKVPLDTLKLDRSLQFRAQPDAGHVEALAVAYAEGAAVPPLRVYPDGDGRYAVVDGHQRRLALQALGAEQAEVELVDEAPDRAAAFAANLAHGLPPSREERATHARWLKSRDPSLSERDLSKLVGLSPSSVHRALAAEREPASGSREPDFARQLVRLVTRAIAEGFGGRPDAKGSQAERVLLLAAVLEQAADESVYACLFIGHALHTAAKMERERREQEPDHA